MNRNQKESLVAKLREHVVQSEAAFLVNYQGLSVGRLQKLRASLRGEGASMRVAKARLMVRAVKDIDGCEQLVPMLKNQIGLVFATGNAPAVAKTLVDFAKDDQKLAVVSGFFENRVWSKPEVEYLAALPSRDVLLTQLACVLQAPIAGLARVLDKVAGLSSSESAPVIEEK
jgi:large subunit ribosomal protein L10